MPIKCLRIPEVITIKTRSGHGQPPALNIDPQLDSCMDRKIRLSDSSCTWLLYVSFENLALTISVALLIKGRYIVEYLLQCYWDHMNLSQIIINKQI